jgi:hypothetical protein
MPAAPGLTIRAPPTYLKEIMAYTYKGTQRDVEPAPAPKPAPLPDAHGTTAGYQTHYRRGDRGEDICQPCRDARAAKKREARAAKGLKPGRKPIYGTGCGSPAGYTAHLRRDERPCDECRAAYNARKCEYNRQVGRVKGYIVRVADRVAA